MAVSDQIKPITYLESNAAEIVERFSTNPEPITITRDGEAKMVLMDIAGFERQQEVLALLKLIAMGREEFSEGNYSDAIAFMDEIDDKGP